MGKRCHNPDEEKLPERSFVEDIVQKPKHNKEANILLYIGGKVNNQITKVG